MRSHRCQHPSASLRRAGSSLYQSRQTPLVPVLEHVDMLTNGKPDTPRQCTSSATIGKTDSATAGRTFLLTVMDVKGGTSSLAGSLQIAIPNMRPINFFMCKPSDRPETPSILVGSLQVALPMSFDDPLVQVLEHVDMPTNSQSVSPRMPIRNRFKFPVAFRFTRAASRSKRSRRRLHYTPARERELGKEGLTRRQAQAFHLRECWVILHQGVIALFGPK